MITAESLPSFQARRTFGVVLAREHREGKNKSLKAQNPGS